MASSRVTKQYEAIMDDQFKKLLANMMTVLNRVKSADTFARTPWQAIIENVIY